VRPRFFTDSAATGDHGWRCVNFTIRYTAPSRLRLPVTSSEAGPPGRRTRAARGTRPDMQSTPLLRHILRDEAVTRGLGDVEARMIVEWMADRAEQVAVSAPTESAAWAAVRALCRRARVIACFVRLWANRSSRGSAVQLVASERLHWPLPAGDVDPGELMEGVLAWVDRQDELVAESLKRKAA